MIKVARDSSFVNLVARKIRFIGLDVLMLAYSPFRVCYINFFPSDMYIPFRDLIVYDVL